MNWIKISDIIDRMRYVIQISVQKSSLDELIILNDNQHFMIVAGFIWPSRLVQRGISVSNMIKIICDRYEYIELYIPNTPDSHSRLKLLLHVSYKEYHPLASDNYNEIPGCLYEEILLLSLEVSNLSSSR
ncbi:hypothetical protein RIR_jg6576.t1 [Rhizophagus irregularis DAOM 181602=DAOM 197198]|nr:hypothetical protein RIR_jg6576.t1 [Rhizophagus irregularis DAOM 181602=DAOM 197198]